MEWYRLKLSNVNDKIILFLIENFKTYDEIFKLDKIFLSTQFNIPMKEIEKIYSSRDIDLDLELKKIKDKGISILFYKDLDYPESLRNISNPPTFLYYIGDINLLKSEKRIAVVGTRKATTYGKISCEMIVKDLVKNDVVIISGLADGIDAISHKTSLEEKGKTIAIVGSGLDNIYPKKNTKLWKEIEEKGLIISEYPLGTPPLPYHFPLRNRIIVGLSSGILVVESKSRGGSLITAYLGIDENRDIFAVPGDIYSPMSEGTNALIKNSVAKLTVSAQDILEDYGWENKKLSKKEKLNLTDIQYKIYNTLAVEKNLDEIILATNLNVTDVLICLVELEAQKIIVSIPGGKYRRKK